MDEEKQTIEIDLLALLRAIKQKIWIVIAAVLAGTVIMFSYAAFLITPLYRAESMMYVNNSSISLGSASLSISNGDLSAAQSLVKTYIVILKSRKTLNAVIEKAKLEYTYEQLSKMIDASPAGDTEIFKIQVTSPDPQEAELIANTVARVLPDKISDIVEGSSVKVVDYAVVPAYPFSPSVTKYAVMGCMLGAVISIGGIVLMELFNDTIRSEDYLIQTYDLPILAVIPSMKTSSKQSPYQYGTASTGKGRGK